MNNGRGGTSRQRGTSYRIQIHPHARVYLSCSPHRRALGMRGRARSKYLYAPKGIQKDFMLKKRTSQWKVFLGVSGSCCCYYCRHSQALPLVPLLRVRAPASFAHRDLAVELVPRVAVLAVVRFHRALRHRRFPRLVLTSFPLSVTPSLPQNVKQRKGRPLTRTQQPPRATGPTSIW